MIHLLTPGEKFGELTVLKKTERPGNIWRCSCSCGGSAEYAARDMQRGRRKSCGNCHSVRLLRGERLCCKCRKVLPVSEFSANRKKRDGLQYACRGCLSAELSRRYRDDLEVSRARRRAYFASHPETAARATAKQRQSPYKHAAHQSVARAVKRGQLAKPTACSRCDDTYRVEAHHDDYSKPLDVMWLCTACHRVRHAELAAQGIDPEAAFRESEVA